MDATADASRQSRGAAHDGLHPANSDSVAEPEWGASPDGTPSPAMAGCLMAAVAAPSALNTQPWLFRVHDAAVDVLADRQRQLPVADPDGRELTISVGAALLNLRLAMLAAGRQPQVQLLPDPSEPDLLATVRVGGNVAPDPADARLARAIVTRQTNRRPYGSMPVPEWMLADISAAAVAEGAQLRVADAETEPMILDVTRRAEGALIARPEYRRELESWTATAGRPDGVRAVAFGPRPELAALPVRDFDPAHRQDRRVEAFEDTPTLAVLHTPGDDRSDWLRAGQALERVLLTAAVHGMAAAPMTQAIELPELRAPLAGDSGPAQVVLRLGFAGRMETSVRRPLDDVLVRSGV